MLFIVVFVILSLVFAGRSGLPVAKRRGGRWLTWCF